MFWFASCSCDAAAQAETDELRKPKHGNVYVIAHRGAHDGVPENTLAAYQRAIDLNCDFIEIDVRTTKDNQLVSIHDGTIDRYTVDGMKGTVANMTLAEIKAVDIGTRVDPKWKDEKIPLLDEIFAMSKGRIGVYLDVKAADINSLYEIVKRHGMERDCLWYIPGEKIGELRERSTLCWPMPDPGPELFLQELLNKHRPRVVASVWRWFSPTFAQTCHESNAIVIVDEGDKDSWGRALQWGTDGIQTDHPKELIEFLNARQSGRR